MEKIVVADGYVKQIARSHARRIAIVVLGSGARYLQFCGAVERRRADGIGTDGRRLCGVNCAAEKPRLKLLVRREDRGVHNRVAAERAIRAVSTGAGDRPGHEAAVVSPIEADPRAALCELVLQMSGEVEFLVVVDAKGREASRLDRNGADASDLRIEKTRRYAGHHDERRESTVVRNIGTDRVAGNFRIIPCDRKRDWRSAENAEVVGVVRVLPDVFAVHDEIFAEGLLQAGVKLVAVAGRQGGRSNCYRAGVWIGAA